MASRIAVFGTGALGCAIGAALARSGEAVTLVGSWARGRRVIAQRGIRVHEPDGVWAARAGAAAVEEVPRPIAVALVLAKSHQTAALAPVVARTLAPSGLALTLQNGLGNREALEQSAGSGRVAVGVTRLGATLLGPGEVRVVPGPIVLGEEPATAEAVLAVAARLRRAGLGVDTTRDVPRLVWRKLVANCAINSLTALAGVPNGALLEDPDLRARLLRVAAEVGAVAAAKGIDLGGDPGELAAEVARSTATNRSSMLQDLARAAITEIDALNGAVAAEGRHLGVPVPENEALWRQVRQREGRPVGEDAELAR